MMAYILRKTYQYLYYWYDYVISSRPASLLYRLRPSRKVTLSSTAQVMTVVNSLYQQEELGLSNAELCQKVQQLNFYEDILSIKDRLYDLNLLHHAIVVNNRDVVNILLQNVWYPPWVECNSPTHLACMLGHTDIVIDLVSKRPLDLYKEAGLCYPVLHQPIDYVVRYEAFFHANYKCETDKLLPIEWAIAKDRVECVDAIVDLMKTVDPDDVDLAKFLHFSARRGAEKCLLYFIRKIPEDIDDENDIGDVPLLEAVVWGRKCVKILIDNGARVNSVAQNGDTALHRLYRNDVDGIFKIFDTTRYLLNTGVEQLVNAINVKGETALHLLVTHISYIGGNCVRPDQQQERTPRWQLQPDYQDQVIETIQLLLSYNADPHIYDSLRLQPLNKLLHVTMKASNPTNECACVQESINSKYIYRNDFKSLSRAIDVLIQNGAEVDTQCALGHTPLIMFIQTLLKTDVPVIVDQASSVLRVLRILLENGARSDFSTEGQCTCSSLLAQLAKKIFSVGEQHESFRMMKQRYGKLIKAILTIFLSHGMDPNFTTTKKCRHLSGGMGNALIEFVRIAMHARFKTDFGVVYEWLLTLLQWGADPDLEPYQSEPIICHSQSSIFLKKMGTQAVSHYIHEVKELQAIFEKGYAEQFLLLFYKTMDHKVLYDCLTTACFMARFHPRGATGNHFLTLISNMADNPRSLKQIARVAIYKALQRKLTTRVDELPLPRSMKEYLLNVE